ncbi:MAG TPA: S9 family peptidase [Terriglobales bacterium]|nr:S9 family peptidase [Terriglobales bacterium]
MRFRRFAAVSLVFLLATLALTQQPARRLITEKDIFRFIWVADPQLSPAGDRVAFTRVVVNDKGDGYETSLWSVAADGQSEPTRLTSGTRDAQPRWSPDGKRLAFLRAPLKDGKPAPAQLFVMPLSGGEAWQLTDVPNGASAAVWSPDGKRIAFTSDTNEKDLAKQKKERAARKTVQDEKKEEPGEKKPGSETATGEGSAKPQEGATPKPPDESDRESDVRTITRAIYRFNGPGYLDPKHVDHLWVVDVPEFSDKPVDAKQLTTGKYDEAEPLWSRDGSTLYFSTTRIDEPYYETGQTDLYSIPAAGGEMKKVAAIDMDVNNYSLSPDGRLLAFNASITKPVQSYTQPDLWTLDLATGKLTNLTDKLDWDVGGGVFGDNGAPRGNSGSRPIWTADGKAIIERVADKGRANLMRFPLDGGDPTPVTKGDPAVMTYRGNPDGRLIFILSSPTAIGDIWMLDGAQTRQLTHFNQPLFSQLNLTEPVEIWYTSFDGKKIQAWVQRPPDFDPGKKYPLILNIHGGPHAAYGWVFDHEFQWMAAKGYLVLYPNPRGSTSYGQDFGNIIQYKYPGDDYKDLMAGVDEVIKRGWADPEKLGVTGGSGGGVLTNWTVTHTNRFKAAVSQRDIADWSNWWYTADFTLFQPAWFRQPPFLDPQDYANRSAITHVTNIHTPIAFILGEVDWRTPPTAGGEVLFRALKYLKRPTAMVRFPNESHELSRSGQPWHRVERLQAIVGWMDKYILGKDVAQFRDVTGQDVSVPPGTTKPPATPKPNTKPKGKQ